ncbi:potassium voltage-gated channel subfamily H member 2-like [Brachionus plicatilis]|uniref:Potassium voltage-gated channel subfamily H member 2-like n=1 Tax=Brachionus plicatilis TaxID=10195 RepID=A0A3M7PHG8_BRAPC|nr:potassium voltage-gated channel subfamily H member 2-like [Brachionus plicatilis]
MPVRRGHVAPQNTFIDTIIRKFDSQNRKFLISNAQVDQKPIIYCNDLFCDLMQYQRGELMQRPCSCEFMFGPMTSKVSKDQLFQAISGTEETQVIVLLYKKDGSNFLCKVLVAPVKNENSEVILFILNFDELNETLDNKYHHGSSDIKRNRLLQQIGMPFISSIFTRSSSPVKSDPMVYFSHRNKAKSNDNIEQIPLNSTKAVKEIENYDQCETIQENAINSNGAKIKIINEDVDEARRRSQEILNGDFSQFSSSRTVRSNNFLDPISCANSSDYLNKSKATSLKMNTNLTYKNTPKDFLSSLNMSGKVTQVHGAEIRHDFTVDKKLKTKLNILQQIN